MEEGVEYVLFPAEETPGPVSTEVWNTEENKSLVEFVILHGDPHMWPSHSITSKFWKSASDFVKQRSNSLVLRSGSYIRLLLYSLMYMLITWKLAD